MQDTILILTLMIVTRTAVIIATIICGLDQDTEIIFAQMSWKFITKCLLETGRQHKTNKAKNNDGNNNKPTRNKQEQ